MTTVLAMEPEHERVAAVVIDGSATVRGSADVAVQRLRSLPGGGLAQDPRALLAAVVSAGRAAVAQADIDIDVVTMTGRADAVLAWDPDSGLPLSSLVVRAEHTGLAPRPPPYRAATGLAPDRRHGRRCRDDTGQLADTPADREFVTDAATAGQSLLTDANGLGWDDDMLQLFGLSPTNACRRSCRAISSSDPRSRFGRPPRWAA